MIGRFGTCADVLLYSKAMDAILSATDSAVSDDTRVGVYLGGELCSDENGTFFEVCGILPSPEGAVGMAVTSSESGTEPSIEDIRDVSVLSPHAVLIIVDPYACEFSVYVVDDGQARKASAVMVD